MWETFHKEEKLKLERKSIPGGWLIRVTQQGPDRYVFAEIGGHDAPGEITVTVTFAVDPNHTWEFRKQQ